VLAHSPSGNYRFLAAEGRPFSSGIVADEGYDLVHARFERPVPLETGLAGAVRHVVAAGRTAQAIAGLELRIPGPLSGDGFEEFNRAYVSSLKGLGLVVDGLMPAARTNVAPAVSGVSEPSVYAVTYTIPMLRTRPGFLLSGVPETEGNNPAEMLASIMKVLSARLDELGARWDDATAIQLYGLDDFQDALIKNVLPQTGRAAIHGIQWFPSRPPIESLKFEIDLRAVGTELVLAAV
jgi:hypothetical protein